MKSVAHRDLTLQAYTARSCLPLLTSFVENAAIAMGLEKTEALALTLATEEVFLHLCGTFSKEEEIEVRCARGGYYVRADFLFPAQDLDLHAFNITTSVSPMNKCDVEMMGLVLASRSVDCFRLLREAGHRVRLELIKEKAYPMRTEDLVKLPKGLMNFSLRAVRRGEILMLSGLVKTAYEEQFFPHFFNYPGKLLDMLDGGEYDALVAVGPLGEVGGVILWHWMNARTVECFGPYVFGQDQGSRMGVELLEGCIAAIARTQAIGLFNCYPTPQLSLAHFELLGSVFACGPDGTKVQRDRWFRLIQEDPGSVAWGHPLLERFLRREYQRLVLPREVRLIRSAGESQPRHSVFFTEFDRPNARVVLHPAWPGADLEENLLQHLELLRREGILNVFFMMDLGQSWQPDFVPVLMVHGFHPCLIIPYAGVGDLVLFQLQGERS